MQLKIHRLSTDLVRLCKLIGSNYPELVWDCSIIWIHGNPQGSFPMYLSHQMSIDNSIHEPVFILDPAVTSSLSSQVLRDNKPKWLLGWTIGRTCWFSCVDAGPRVEHWYVSLLFSQNKIAGFKSHNHDAVFVEVIIGYRKCKIQAITCCLEW